MNDDIDRDDVIEEMRETTGIVSRVSWMGQPCGHVLLCDHDDAEWPDVSSWAADLPGLTMVASSSPGSYHTWNMTVMDEATVLKLMMDAPGADLDHARTGFRARKWVLRIAPKFTDDGDIDKSAPMPRLITYRDTDMAQSISHAAVAASMCDDVGKSEEVERTMKRVRLFVGDPAGVEHYMTVSDRLKRVLNDG